MLQLPSIAPTARESTRTHAREHCALPRRAAACATKTKTSVARSAAPRLVPGQTLGARYHVGSLLAEGGMGAVYRVFDRALQHDVALKSVRGDDAVLRDEVRLAQQISHGNVCRTFDLEEIDGRHFVKMEYIAGESLASHLRRVRKLPIARTVAIARAIAEGLGAAHAHGIVHRDLKPANVMLDGERVVLIDFGLAQRAGNSDCAGTPEYMSPEQLASTSVEAASDLYSLGCVVFEMLVGMPPFCGSTVDEVLARRRGTPPPDIRSLRADVPRALAAAVRAMLAENPAQRAAGLAYFVGRPRRSRIAIAGVAAVCIVAAIARAAVPSAAWEPTLVDLAQYDENADDPSLSPDASALVYSADRGHRDTWAVYVAAHDGAEPRRVSPEGAFCIGGRWMHDARAIVMSCYLGGERRILEQPVAGGAPRDLGPGWAVDDCGDRLAVVVERPTGAALVLRDRDLQDVEVARFPALSSVRCDGRGERMLAIESAVAVPCSAGKLVVIDRATGEQRELPGVRDVESATFAPDGDTIVFAKQLDRGTSLYEIGYDGGTIHEITPHESYATSPHVTSDGTSLIFDRDRTSIPLFEIGTRGVVQRTFRFERLTHVVASPSDDTLVATRLDPDTLTVIAIDPNGYVERELAMGEALAITRAGDVVVRAIDNPRRLTAVPIGGAAPRTLATLPARALDAADGPDGLHVELARDGVSEAWRIEHDGALVREDVAGLVMPAPDGGWRVVKTTDGMRVTLRFIAPGHALTEPAFERDAIWGQPIWVDAQTFAYCDVQACRSVDVETQRDVVATVERPGNRPLTVGRDGARWFAASHVGHVSRHVVTNFAKRPWAR